MSRERLKRTAKVLSAVVVVGAVYACIHREQEASRVQREAADAKALKEEATREALLAQESQLMSDPDAASAALKERLSAWVTPKGHFLILEQTRGSSPAMRTIPSSRSWTVSCHGGRLNATFATADPDEDDSLLQLSLSKARLSAEQCRQYVEIVARWLADPSKDRVTRRSGAETTKDAARIAALLNKTPDKNIPRGTTRNATSGDKALAELDELIAKEDAKQQQARPSVPLDEYAKTSGTTLGTPELNGLMRRQRAPEVASQPRSGTPPDPAPRVDPAGSVNSEVWRRIKATDWLSFELPSAWLISSAEFKGTVAAWMETKGISGKTAANSFMASLVPVDARRAVAIMNVRFYPDEPMGQNNVRGLDRAEVAQLDAALRAGLMASAEKAGFRVITWLGTKREAVGKFTVLVSEYHRGPIQPTTDTWHVRLFRVYDAEKSFTLTVSHELASAAFLRPITDRIAYSIRSE